MNLLHHEEQREKEQHLLRSLKLHANFPDETCLKQFVSKHAVHSRGHSLQEVHLLGNGRKKDMSSLRRGSHFKFPFL